MKDGRGGNLTCTAGTTLWNTMKFPMWYKCFQTETEFMFPGQEEETSFATIICMTMRKITCRLLFVAMVTSMKHSFYGNVLYHNSAFASGIVSTASTTSSIILLCTIGGTNAKVISAIFNTLNRF